MNLKLVTNKEKYLFFKKKIHHHPSCSFCSKKINNNSVVKIYTTIIFKFFENLKYPF